MNWKIIFVILLASNCAESYSVSLFDGRFVLEWIITRENIVRFTATAETQGWVGLGINNVLDMGGAQYVVGGIYGESISTTVGTTGTGMSSTTATGSTESDTATPGTPPTTVTSVTTTSTTTTRTTTTTTDPPTSSTQNPSSPTTTNPTPSTTPPTTTPTRGTDPITFPPTGPTTTNTGSTTQPSSTISPPVTAPTFPPISSSPPPFTFPTNPPSRQLPETSYFLTFISQGGPGLGLETPLPSWRNISASQTPLVTKVSWERDLATNREEDTQINQYEDVYITVLYSNSDYDANYDTNTAPNLPIERYTWKTNLILPSSSTSLTSGTSTLTFLLFCYFRIFQ